MTNTVKRPVWVEVDLAAIENNYRLVKDKVDSQVVMPVVKADAYGHGAVKVARRLFKAGAERFAVALPEEGVELREEGIIQPIQVLFKVFEEQYPLVFEYNLIPTVADELSLNNLNQEALARGVKLKVHIVLDTGMGRQGFLLEDAERILPNIKGYQGLQLEGMMTHFSCADERNKYYSYYQWGKLKKVFELLGEKGIDIPLKHAANSASILDLPGFMLDMVRPGIITYGLRPSKHISFDSKFKPALSWKARISEIRRISVGSALSYGGTYITEKDSLIAAIPLGYADGYPRRLSNQGYVLIRGQKAPIRGIVCMDQLLVDVSDIPGVANGDEVVLIGKQGDQEITAEHLAEICGTINYEIVCGISKRVPRVYPNN